MIDRCRRGVAGARLVLAAFGWKGIARRAWYVARLRSGWLRRQLPCAPDFADQPVASWSHRFNLAAVRRRYDDLGIADEVRTAVLGEGELLLAGELRFYGGDHRQVGWPPQWTATTDGTPLPLTHWTAISDNLPAGDIKDVWEPSRLGSTFLLARAYFLTDDARFVEQWWVALEDWATSNPPNTGPNWRCGQETSLRGIAICFGLSAFGDQPASTPARLQLAGRILGASVRRVRPTIGYALSQRNNHAISELAFLLAVGDGDDRHLCSLLLEALDDQFYDDGSYSQQSFVYERLALHTLIWLLHVQPDLPADVGRAMRDRLRSAAGFIERCADPISGAMPNYGANDGSLLLDLALADRLDARPLLTLLGATTFGGLAAEPSAWLPPSAVGLSDVPQATGATSTYRTMRGDRSHLITRIGSGRHRPGDDDQQAIELFLDGTRVVLDPGTYRYSGSAPWRQPFVDVAAHSAVVAARRGERAAVGRFLRAPMAPASEVSHSNSGSTEVLVTERVEHGITLTRAIVRVDDRYAVVDTADGAAAKVHWVVPDTAEQLQPGVFSVGGVLMSVTGVGWRVRDRSRDDPMSGWWSPTYAQLRPAIAVELDIADGGAALACFAPAGAQLLGVDEIAAALGEQVELRQRMLAVVKSMSGTRS